MNSIAMVVVYIYGKETDHLARSDRLSSFPFVHLVSNLDVGPVADMMLICMVISILVTCLRFDVPKIVIARAPF